MHFVIIGNGVAGTTAALTIRQREPEALITLMSGESDYFYSRTALMYAYMDRVSLRDLEPHERRVYDRQSIRRVRDWVVNLDARTHVLQLKSGGQLTYDRLLLATGSAPNIVPWRGLAEAREGAVSFISLQDLEACERLTTSTREAVVVGGGLIGVELVECLVYHGKRVTFLVREPWYWPLSLSGPEGDLVSAHIRRHGVDLHLEEQVDEVLSDAAGRVRGIKGSSGVEYPCQMLGITTGVRPAIDWLRPVTTAPELGRGIRVSPSFATSLPDVWAAGDCAEIDSNGERPFVEQIWYSAKRQGELAARAMLGDTIAYRKPIFYNSAKFFDIEYTTVGWVVELPSDASSFFYRFPNSDASIRIVERQGSVIGFNMLGSRWDHTYFERWIEERRSLEYVMKHLAQAQFDVEFGRRVLAGAIAEYERKGGGVGQRNDSGKAGA